MTAPTTCHSQLEVTAPTYETYASAAALLWGEAGKYAAAEFARINRELFAGSIPPVPVIIGLAAYGGCLGQTRPLSWLASPRLLLATEIFNGSDRMKGGPRQVSDVLTHEIVHAVLILRGGMP